MDQRSGDEIEQRIRQWERTRDDLGPAAPYALISYLNDEIAKLRHEKAMRDKPLPGGRRASDPRPATAPGPLITR